MRHSVVIYTDVAAAVILAAASLPRLSLSLSAVFPQYLTFFQAEKIMSRRVSRGLRLTQVKARTSIVAAEAATRTGNV